MPKLPAVSLAKDDGHQPDHECDSQFPTFQVARDRFEKDYLMELLTLTKGNVSVAAKMAKRNRSEFYRLLSHHKILPAYFRQMQSNP